MSTNVLKYLRSAEALNHINPKNSNFANAAFAQTSSQAFDYERMTPQTARTAFGEKHTFNLYKPEAVISQLQWKCTLSALAPAAGQARDAINYLRWRKFAPMEGVESVSIIFGNEAAEKYPGYWIYLQNICFDDPKRRQREEVWDLPAADRDALSAGQATFYLNLKPFCLRHPGTYLPTHALREQLRIEIQTRALASWYETNMSGTPSATIVSDELLVEFTVLPPAELKTYIDKPWRIPMKSESHIERETITAATRHDVVLTYKGVVEGYWIGLRSSTGAQADGTYLNMDRVSGLTIGYSVNNQPVIVDFDAEYFRRETYKYLPQRPDYDLPEGWNWYYIPMSLAADKMASSGCMDHNVPSRIEINLKFTAAFSGDVTVVSPVRNVFAIRSGKAQKRYA